jgi:ubiquinone/menaquinone biosynthesis C-methylase UbiE
MPHFLAHVIDNPLRRRLQPPERLARWHGLEPGMRLLEVGPGSGTYTVAAAGRVGGRGSVVAVDIEPAMLRWTRRQADEKGVPNLRMSVADVAALPFAAQSFDAVTLIAVLGEIPEPVAAMRELGRVLRPNGILGVSELLPDPDYPRRTTVMRWAEAAGFRLRAAHGNVLAYTLQLCHDDGAT